MPWSELWRSWLEPGSPLAELVSWGPALVRAGVTIVVGVVAALVARWVVRRVVRRSGLDVLAERVGLVRLLYAINVRSSLERLLSNLAGLAVLLITAMAVAEGLHLPGVAEGFSAVVEFLPRFVTAAVLAGTGFLVADIVARLVEGVSRRRPDWVSPKLARNLVYYTVAAVFLTTAVQHLGLDTDLVDGLILLVAGIGLASVGLSFALGSRVVVQQLLVRQYAPYIARPGDRVRIGDVEGMLLRYDAISFVLRDDGGQLRVFPCASLLQEQGIVVVPAPTGTPAGVDEESA